MTAVVLESKFNVLWRSVVEIEFVGGQKRVSPSELTTSDDQNSWRAMDNSECGLRSPTSNKVPWITNCWKSFPLID